MLSRTSRVKVHSFSGADTSDMHDFLKPLIKKKPSRIIVHCGTNDLASNQVENIAMNIVSVVFSGVSVVFAGCGHALACSLLTRTRPIQIC